MDVPPIPPRDFDAWRRLAVTDPEAFEAMRRAAIDQAIARFPAERRERLRCLQWRVDVTRKRAKTPLAACIALSGLMWEAVTGPHGLLNALHGRSRPSDRALLIPFRGCGPGDRDEAKNRRTPR